MRHTTIVSFGCPRSGTTWLYRCLSALHGIVSLRIPDGAKLHPSKTPDGLISLAATLYDRDVVFVRIIRSPLDIVDSFLALRKLTPGAARANDTNERIVRWIVSEHVNMAMQRRTLIKPQELWGRHSVVELRYEDMASAEGREAFVNEIVPLLPDSAVNRVRLLGELETFGNRPYAIFGKLKAGLDGPVMTPEERAYFAEQLHDVIEETGYEDEN